MDKSVETIQESNSGRNKKFHDVSTGKEMTRDQFSDEIEKGNYSNYHVRKVNGLRTPASNPDKSKNNNLG
jgi:hypothetical protein